MSKRVLIISQHFYPEIGSAGNRIKNIFHVLKTKGYTPTVLTIEPSYPNKNIYHNNPEFWDDEAFNDEERNTDHIIRIKVKSRRYAMSMLNRLFYYLKVVLKLILYVLFHKGRYHAIYVTSPPIFIAFAGLIAKYRYRTKMVLDIRDLWPESLKGVGVFNHRFILAVFKRFEKFLYQKSDKIVVNSQGFIEYMEKHAGIDVSKIAFIPNSIREYELGSPKKDNETFKVIYAGNIGLAQDSSLLLDLAENLAKFNFRLDIIGYGVNKNKLMGEIEMLGLQNVHFINPLSRKQCFALISQYDVGIMTLNNKQVFETVLPGKVIDYMACGVPIVAMASGFSKRIIEEARAGLCSESYDVQDIIKPILYLHTHQHVRGEMGQNGLNYIRKHFLWEKNGQKLIDVIEAI